MNWVDKRADKEHAISLQADFIWERLVRALKDSVDTFSKRYPEKSKREYGSDQSGAFWVKKTVPDVMGQGGHWIFKSVAICFTLNRDSHTIAVDGHTAKPTTLAIDAEDGRVFLTSNGIEKSIEECCQSAIETFLFNDD